MADSLLKVLAFNDEVKAVAMVATDAIAEAQRRQPVRFISHALRLVRLLL